MNAPREGIVTRFHSNRVDVLHKESHTLFSCVLRGRFKRQNIRPIPGDHVEFLVFPDGSGRVESILPRKSELKRPNIANIDQVVVITTMRAPAVPLQVLDGFLVLGEEQGLELFVVFNKVDLLDGEQLVELDALEAYYGQYYTFLRTSARSGQGLEGLRRVLNGRISSFAGMSGVGKSSLLNSLDPSLNLKEGELSENLERGKHTTTYSNLLPVQSGGLVADTPGIGLLTVEGLQPGELQKGFPDFAPFAARCFFEDCLHDREPDCAVIQAVKEGKILPSRYESYHSMLLRCCEVSR